MHIFERQFVEQGPPGPMKQVIMLNFVQEMICEAASFFTKRVQDQLKSQTLISTEEINELKVQITELQTRMRSESEAFETRIREKDMAKTELQASEEALKQILETEKQGKKALEKEHAKKLAVLKKENTETISKYEEKVERAQESEK